MYIIYNSLSLVHMPHAWYQKLRRKMIKNNMYLSSQDWCSEVVGTSSSDWWPLSTSVRPGRFLGITWSVKTLVFQSQTTYLLWTFHSSLFNLRYIPKIPLTMTNQFPGVLNFDRLFLQFNLFIQNYFSVPHAWPCPWVVWCMGFIVSLV